ncbi:17201_t:CDS:1, partial [Cetraspora pellucida]
PILELDLPPSNPELSTVTPTPMPDATLTIILQLQQQVAYQSQLIERLETKVDALESFNQQLIQ